MNVKLSHIAIASPDVKSILERLEVLSLKVGESHDVPSEGVRAEMIPVEVSPEFRVEILGVTSDASPIAKYLSRNPKGGIHHLCFEVENLEDWPPVLEKAGIEILPPGIRPAARGRALFMHPRSFGGVLVELEEIAS